MKSKQVFSLSLSSAPPPMREKENERKKQRQSLLILSIEPLCSNYRERLNEISRLCFIYPERKNDFISWNLCEILVSLLSSSITRYDLRTAGYLVKYLIDLLRDDDENYSIQLWNLFLQAGLFGCLLKFHTVFKSELSIIKPLTYLMKYYADKGISLDEDGSSRCSPFFDEAIIILMRKDCTLAMMSNYCQCFTLMSTSKEKFRPQLESALFRVLAFRKSRHLLSPSHSSFACNEFESLLITAALAVCYVWEQSCLASNVPNLIALWDFLLFGMKRYCDRSHICMLVCLSLKQVLENTNKGPIFDYLLNRNDLIELLVEVVQIHQTKYRLLVAALDCFRLLSFGTMASPLVSSYTLKSTSFKPSPGSTSENTLYHSSDIRINELLSNWYPPLLSCYYDSRWVRRKSFCFFLVCCCSSSFVYSKWGHRSSENRSLSFPSLELIFSTIAPLKRLEPMKKSCPESFLDFIFFSKSICILITSYL